MSDNIKTLRSTIGNVLEQHGFQVGPQKERIAWYRSHPDTVLVFDLQKSDYGGQYFGNLGVCLKSIYPSEFPREELCHLRLRLDRLVPDRERVLSLLDLEEQSVQGEARARLLADLITNVAVPWFDKFRTAESLTQELSKSELLMNRSTIQLKRALKVA